MEKEASYYSGLLRGFISNTIPVEEVTELLIFIEAEPGAYQDIIEGTEIQTLLEQQAYNNAINIPEAVSIRMKERLMAAIKEGVGEGGIKRIEEREVEGVEEREVESFEVGGLDAFRQKRGTVISLWKRIAAAATVLIFISFGAYFIFKNKTPKETAQTQIANTKNDVVAPANTKATITLSNGQTILVDSLNSGTLTTQGNVRVLKTAEGQIIYNGSSKEVVYNTLLNPRGSKAISLTLSDGSQVWLNTASSLRYPIAFVGNERKVEIKGEAYFEISHNATKPFVVTKGETSVTVLGTHFNVNAYDDEENIKITLLEGSVKVGNSIDSKVIKPGQQAVLRQANYNKIEISNKVDLDEVMAWKNDLFHFESADVQTILRQFARWYDVEVVYEDTPTNKKFFGIVSRKSTLTEVLQLLKENDIKFRIDRKKLIVTSG